MVFIEVKKLQLIKLDSTLSCHNGNPCTISL